MVVAEVLEETRRNQMALLTLTLLELTGFMFPPPVQLRNGDSFDYIIVGGGTSGSVIATRLVQKNYNVLLVEAGDDAPFETVEPRLVNYIINSHVDWNYTAKEDNFNFQCHNNKVVKFSLGKMLGGSGQSNYMIYSRGNPENFELWHKITQDPIWEWRNVLPYFIKAENINDSDIKNSPKKGLFGYNGYIGVTRDQDADTERVLKGFRQAGHQIIPDIDGNRNGYARGLRTLNLGERQATGTKYLSRISESHYIATAKKTLATKIFFHENKTVSGVELITDNNQKITVYARKEVIVACGAIKSAQLLLLSGIGPRKHLEHFKIKTISDLPVGKNLQDQVAIFIPHKTNQTIDKTIRPPSKYPTGVFVGYASVNKFLNQQRNPDYSLSGKIIDDLDFLVQQCSITFNLQKEVCEKLYSEANNNKVISSLLFNLHAHSRGQVLLQSTDPRDPPNVIHPGVSDFRDFFNLIDYIIDYLKVEKTQAFKNLDAKLIDVTCHKCNKWKIFSRLYWRCYISSMMVSLKSFAGTCALGSVLDSRLRVRGVHGLRVADASIMPTLVSGAPFNTVVMIGEKAADIIIEDAGSYNLMKHDMIRPDQIKNMPD